MCYIFSMLITQAPPPCVRLTPTSALVVGVASLSRRQERVIPFFGVQLGEGSDPPVLTGPVGDSKSEYLASRLALAHSRPVLEVDVTPLLGELQVSVLDELNRPWVLTGLWGPDPTFVQAKALLACETFLGAITVLRQHRFDDGGAPPADVAQMLEIPEPERTPHQRQALAAYIDRHWSVADA